MNEKEDRQQSNDIRNILNTLSCFIMKTPRESRDAYCVTSF